MRRLTLLALAGALVLSACSDQNTDSPTEPSVAPPSETFGSTCTHGRYPLRDIAPLTQDADIFNGKAERAEALLRVGAIALLWDTCNDAAARKAALSTIKWINANARQNNAARRAKVAALNAAILAGFGGTGTEGAEYAADVYQPGTTKIITTPSGRGTIKLTPGAFNEPTVITVKRLPDNFPLTGLPEGYVQDGPVWDYDATNSTTNNDVATHTVATPGAVTIAFCIKDDVFGEIPEPGVRIGHQPVSGPFEFVNEVDVPPDLLAELDACNSNQGGLGAGFPGLSKYLASVAQKVLLPEPLYAAVVGTRGPIAGTPSSLSPFGIVKQESGQVIPSLSCTQEGTIKSLNSDVPVTLTFVNNTEQSVSVYWLNFEGLRWFQDDPEGFNVPYMVLEPGTSYAQPTYVTHPWILIGEDETCYGIFVPSAGGGTVTVPSGQIN